MKKTLSCILVLLAVIPACKDKKNLIEEVAETWPDGNPKKVFYYQVNGEKKDKIKEIRFFQSGKKEMEGNLKASKKEGIWIFWFENGRKQSENTFTNDLRNGKSVVWRENGKKYYEGSYSMGKLHGTWIFYDGDGNKTKEVLYEHDNKVKEIDFQQGVPMNPKE